MTCGSGLRDLPSSACFGLFEFAYQLQKEVGRFLSQGSALSSVLS